MRSLGTKKDLAGRKNWPHECLAVRPFAGVEWAYAAIMTRRPGGQWPVPETPKNTTASGRSFGRHALNPRTRKRGKLQAVSIFTKPMHRVIDIMDEISS